MSIPEPPKDGACKDPASRTTPKNVPWNWERNLTITLAIAQHLRWFCRPELCAEYDPTKMPWSHLIFNLWHFYTFLLHFYTFLYISIHFWRFWHLSTAWVSSHQPSADWWNRDLETWNVSCISSDLAATWCTVTIWHLIMKRRIQGSCWKLQTFWVGFGGFGLQIQRKRAMPFSCNLDFNTMHSTGK